MSNPFSEGGDAPKPPAGPPPPNNPSSSAAPDANPFTGGAQPAGGTYETLQEAAALGSVAHGDIALTDKYSSSSGLQQKEVELQKWQADLEKRERILVEREAALGALKPNFPRCWPLVRHHIKIDIPEKNQRLVTWSFRYWIMVACTLFLNFIGVIVMASEDGLLSKQTTEVFFSISYFLLGPPIGWLLWYKNIYATCRSPRKSRFLLFFPFYVGHMIFSLIMALGIPSTAGAGLLYMTEALDKGFSIGGFVVVTTILWLLEVAFGVLLFTRVSAYYKAEKGGVDDTAEVAAKAASTSAVRKGVGSAI